MTSQQPLKRREGAKSASRYWKMSATCGYLRAPSGMKGRVLFPMDGVRGLRDDGS